MKNNYKPAITLLQLIALAFSLHAQTINTPPTIAWQATIGGTKDEVVNCLKPIPGGGFVIAGSSSSNDGNMSGNHGVDDFFLIKLNDTGNIVWQKSYGGSLMDEASSVAITLDGGYILAGKSSSNNGDVTFNYGFSDYWIIKTDDKGKKQWQKSYGGSMSDIANSIQVTSDSGFIVAGVSYSNDDDVTDNHGNGDAWIIKLDKNGTLQWQKAFGGSLFDIANDVHQTPDGGLIVAGYTVSNDGDILYNHGQEDFWIFKLDENGNLQWQNTMGGTGGDCASAVQPTLDGGYVLCGLTHSRDYDIDSTLGAHDAWVVKTDSLGVIQWSHSLGGSDGDDGTDIKQQPDGTLIACAFSSSNDGDVSGNHGGFDNWVVQLNPGCINVFYADADSDGYGDSKSFIYSCTQPSGYVTDSTDCNDNPLNNGATIHPGANEVCNYVDDDCNGLVDEGLTFITYYVDADNDGFGSSSIAGIIMCSDPGVGYSTDHSDCDDSNASINPGAGELCNSIDDNCNGQIDEACGNFTYYADADGDTYGDPFNLTISSSPIPPAGFVADNTDCNDNDPSVHSPQLFYVDEDEDGFGSLATAMVCASVAPAGYSLDNTDCDDANAFINPGAAELCNSLDDNCNTQIDEGAVVATVTPSGNVDACLGDIIILEANTGIGLTYQWERNGYDIPDATN